MTLNLANLAKLHYLMSNHVTYSLFKAVMLILLKKFKLSNLSV